MAIEYKPNYSVFQCTKCKEKIIIDEEEQPPEECYKCEIDLSEKENL